MIEQIRVFLKSFASCPQLAKIYLFSHPEVARAIHKAHDELLSILKIQSELVIAIVGDEIASGEDIFFDLSKRLSSFISVLKSKNAEKISFKQGITYEEFENFVFYFLNVENSSYEIQEYLKEKKVFHILVDNIRAEEDSQNERVLDKISIEEKYADCILKVSSSITDIVENKEANFANFYFVMDSLVTGIGSHYQEILKLVRLQEKDAITFTHLLNVAFLAIYFSKYIGFNKEDSRNMGMAGLFHDIGKLYISNSILKGGKLTDQEFESIKSHSMLGSKILLNFTDKIGVLAPVVALEHHMKYDGSGGYPQLRFKHPLHLASLIISLCDVYDALSQRRSYKNDYPPEQIYQIMKGGRGSQFSPELFDAFFEYMGIWPNGIIVILNNNKVGVVKQQNPQNIFSPYIEIVSDESFELINLMEMENWEIQKSLNPLNEGKQYLNLIEKHNSN